MGADELLEERSLASRESTGCVPASAEIQQCSVRLEKATKLTLQGLFVRVFIAIQKNRGFASLELRGGLVMRLRVIPRFKPSLSVDELFILSLIHI